MNAEAEQLTLFDLGIWCGRMSPEPSPAENPKARTSASSSRRSAELKAIPYMFLDLTPGHGNLLGESYWELLSPWRGESSMLNTGASPNAAVVSSLSQILQGSVPGRYYLSKTACLGILRRARERGKELPLQLKAALMAQAGLVSVPTANSGLKAYHINQRDESIDLGETSGALMTTINGDPAQAKQSGLRGERRSSGMSELSPLGGSEGYGACDDAQIQTFVTLPEQPTGFDGYNGDLTGDKAATLGTNCGMSTGRNGLIHPVVFAANQRDEVRDLHDVAGAIQAQPGMKQQTFVVNTYSSGHNVISEDKTNTLRAQAHGHQPLVMATQQCGAEIAVGVCPTITVAAGMSGNNQPVLFENHGIDARYTGPHMVVPTLSARAGTGGNNLPLVADTDTPPLCIAGNIIDRQPQNGGNGLGCQEEIAYTLTATDRHAVFSRQRVDVFKDDEVASTQSARQHKDATDLVYQESIGALTSSDCKGPNSQYVSQDKLVVETPMLIRRLTPLECERLQGYPDGWTDIPGASDSARYKALGNSVAIPCVELLMQGIAAVYREGLRYELPQ